MTNQADHGGREGGAADDSIAFLCLCGWAGNSEAAVEVVGETPKRYRIKNAGTEKVKLAGRWRWLMPGDTVLVPKYAIRFERKPQPMITPLEIP